MSKKSFLQQEKSRNIIIVAFLEGDKNEKIKDES